MNASKRVSECMLEARRRAAPLGARVPTRKRDRVAVELGKRANAASVPFVACLSPLARFGGVR